MKKLGIEDKINEKQRQFQVIDYSFNIKPEIRLKSHGSLRRDFRYNSKLSEKIYELI
jgi:hypothetical protein